MQFGKSPDMHLVNNRVIPRDPLTTARTRPIKTGIDDHTFGHKRSAVPLVESEIINRFHLITEYRRVPMKLAGMRTSIWIQEELVSIEPMPGLGSICPVNPISVD